MLLVISLCVFWCIVPSLAENKPLVITPLGPVEGVYETTYAGRRYSAFYSVPYAKPPIGNLRFRDPQPIEPWRGTWPSTDNITFCVQILHVKTLTGGIYYGTENCLFLQIYVPCTNLDCSKKDKLLDVIVFIHSGAFMFGGSPSCGPKFLMDRDIVLVTINYRVGVMGFLSTEDENLPGNLGMKDQALALKWVKNNIQSFGGNPKSITIGGLSAGGASVHFHYLSPLSKGLFHRGISMSGTALAPWALQKDALQKTRFIASKVGCNQEYTGELVNCLRTRSARQLVEATRFLRYWLFNPFSPLSLVVEKAGNNRFLPDHPYILLNEGKIYDAPWITSVTAHEGLYPGADFLLEKSTLSTLNTRWEELAPHILHYNHSVPRYRMDEVSRIIKKTYLKNEEITKTNFYTLVDVMTDRLFGLSSETATLLQAKTNKSPVYYYYFNFIREQLTSLTYLFTEKDQHEGVCHGDDYMYIFSSPLLSMQKLSEMDKQMQTFFLDLWTSFAHNGSGNWLVTVRSHGNEFIRSMALPLEIMLNSEIILNASSISTKENIDWTPVPNDGKTLLQLHIKSPGSMSMENSMKLERYRSMWNDLPLMEDDTLFFNISKDEL